MANTESIRIVCGNTSSIPYSMRILYGKRTALYGENCLFYGDSRFLFPHDSLFLSLWQSSTREARAPGK